MRFVATACKNVISMTKTVRRAIALTFMFLATAAGANAAAVRSGASLAAIIAVTRGTNVAYDSINKVYLVVSAHGLVQGRFIAANGTPIGGQFVIQANQAIFTAFPRVKFSPDANGGAGGFLVTWSASDIPNNASLHGRMVAYGQGGPYGPDNQLSVDGTWWEEGSYIAYSTVSREFLVVFRQFGTYNIRGVRVDNNAAPLAAGFVLSAINQFEDNPSVAYNPNSNQYLICWKGYNDPARFGFVDCKFLLAGTNTNMSGAIRVTQSAATYITDTTYNPSTNQFLVTWDAGVGIFGRIVGADASLPGGPFPVSSIFHAYDGLSVGYNGISRSFFMVSHDARCPSNAAVCEDGGVELADSGSPIDNGFVVTATGAKGSFYPTIAPSVDAPNWLVTTSANFAFAAVQLVTGTASGGGPAPTPGPAPPPVSNAIFAVDTPTNNLTVPSSGFQIGGWAADTGAPAGTGIDVVAVFAYPASGAPAILVGTASYGSSRPDIAGWLGPRFMPSGFNMVGTLAPGAYSLVIYAHSTISNAWTAPKLIPITVTGPISNPRMNVDAPIVNQNTSGNLQIVGWSLDLGAPADVGVSTVHVWAAPAGNPSAAIFLGAAPVGDVRPDVGAAFGSSRFTPSGWHLGTSALTRGQWVLYVFSLSDIGGFNNTMVIPINVL
jgi:hypothetical protein